MPGGCEYVVLRISVRERWLADHAGDRCAGWDAPELPALPVAWIADRGHQTRGDPHGISLGSNDFAPARR